MRDHDQPALTDERNDAVVVIVDEVRVEERIVTVYEPDPRRWSHDFRRRRR